MGLPNSQEAGAVPGAEEEGKVDGWERKKIRWALGYVGSMSDAVGGIVCQADTSTLVPHGASSEELGSTGLRVQNLGFTKSPGSYLASKAFWEGYCNRSSSLTRLACTFYML
jgi:hypothetical protein